MSSATMARPSAVNAPDTAQLLLPGKAFSENDARSCCAGIGSFARSTSSAPGSIALPRASPNNGASHSVPSRVSSAKASAASPLPIHDSEAAAILDRVQEGVEKPRPKVLFEPGQMVRVNDGPFNDFNGVVEEVNYEKSRLRVAVLIFGRSTPVELEFGQVEKA